jgi:hypothetical protein
VFGLFARDVSQLVERGGIEIVALSSGAESITEVFVVAE